MRRRDFLSIPALAPLCRGQILAPIFQGGGPKPPVPFPLFVELHGGFLHSTGAMPTGVASLPTIGTGSAGCGLLTVTGTAGATTITINTVVRGVIANYAGTWSAVIQHDDGSWGCYSATNLQTGASTIDVFPTLAKAVTAQSMANSFDSSDMHMTDTGYAALVWYMFSRTKRYCYKEKYAARYAWDGAKTLASGGSMSLAGGLTNGGYVPGTTDMFKGATLTAANINSPNGGSAYTGVNRSAWYGYKYRYQVTGWLQGHGVTMSAATLSGKSGYFETSAVVTAQEGAALASLAAVSINGGAQLTKVAGFQSVTYPFNAASAGNVSFTLDSAADTIFALGPSVWWSYDPSVWGAMNPDSAIFEPGSKIVVCCDSWGVNHGGIYTPLVSLCNAAQAGWGDTIVNSSVGGTQAAWAIANFNTLVKPYNPRYVIYDFQINDLDVGVVTPAQWVTNIQTLSALSLAIGATPVFLIGIQDGDYAQTAQLGLYVNQLYATYPAAA